MVRKLVSSSALSRSVVGWCLVALVLVGVRVLASPAIIEQVYSRGAFPVIRRALDICFGWWPVPASAVFCLLGVALIVRDLYQKLSGHSASGFSSRLATSGMSVLRSLAILTSFFLLLWGFNYGRQPLPQQIGLEIPELTTQQLLTSLDEAGKHVGILRRQLPLTDTNDYVSLPLPQASEMRIRESLKRQLAELGYPTEGKVRIRRVLYGGLLRFNTSGIYFPFTGEGHLDQGLHSLQVPFVMAHEMAHGYGITDEGTCNFLAWLACTRADNLYFRYAGHLTYLRYLMSAVRRNDPPAYAAFRQNLPAGVQADLASIAENLDRYKEIAPVVRDVVYDNYLKSQGVSDGMASYSRIIGLVAAWQNAQQQPRAVKTATGAQSHSG